jgi:hypothetical protein
VLPAAPLDHAAFVAPLGVMSKQIPLSISTPRSPTVSRTP